MVRLSFIDIGNDKLTLRYGISFNGVYFFYSFFKKLNHLSIVIGARLILEIVSSFITALITLDKFGSINSIHRFLKKNQKSCFTKRAQRT